MQQLEKIIFYSTSDPIVKEQGRMTALPGHTSPTPVPAAGQIGGTFMQVLQS